MIVASTVPVPPIWMTRAILMRLFSSIVTGWTSFAELHDRFDAYVPVCHAALDGSGGCLGRDADGEQCRQCQE
ncbi:hypothetical protein ACVWWO_001237 [Bradyrhizobium sp. F1.13.1]